MEEKMGREQSKNTQQPIEQHGITINKEMKNKSGFSTTRLEHSNTDETEKNDLKITLEKCLMSLKREIKKKSLQEVEEKANKILKESNKILKENER